MKIKHLIINNFRSYKNLELFFNGKYSSIVGENGSGKTSILDAINFCLNHSLIKENISGDDFYKNTHLAISIQIYFDENFFVVTKNGFKNIEIPCNGIYLKIKKALNSKKNFFENFEIDHYAIPKNIIEKNEEGWLVLDKNYKGEKILEISKDIMRFPLNTKNFPKCFYFDKNRNKKNYSGDYLNSSHLSRWSKEILEIFSQNDSLKLKKVFEDIEKIIKENSDIKISSEEIFPLKKELTQFNIDNYLGTCHKNFKKLGSGLETIVNFILIDNIAKLLEKNIIFLIDEPELHLHPQLQKIVFEYIENNTYQYIYSTHSEHMIKINKWKNIIRLNSYEKFPKSHMLNEKIGEKNLKYYLNKLENNYKYETIFLRENNELFFAKKIILVEGVIEKIALPIIFDKFGKKELKKEFTIISVNGKGNMQHFQIICKAFGLKYFSLFDADKESLKKAMNFFIIQRAYEKNYFFFKTSFEKTLTIKTGKNKAFRTIENLKELEKKDFPEEFFEMFKKIENFLKEN